jgi:hypothetical protein
MRREPSLSHNAGSRLGPGVGGLGARRAVGGRLGLRAMRGMLSRGIGGVLRAEVMERPG